MGKYYIPSSSNKNIDPHDVSTSCELKENGIIYYYCNIFFGRKKNKFCNAFSVLWVFLLEREYLINVFGMKRLNSQVK